MEGRQKLLVEVCVVAAHVDQCRANGGFRIWGLKCRRLGFRGLGLRV